MPQEDFDALFAQHLSIIDAALLFDPFDVGSIASALARVICNKGDTDELETLMGTYRQGLPSRLPTCRLLSPLRRIAGSSYATGCETPA